MAALTMVKQDGIGSTKDRAWLPSGPARGTADRASSSERAPHEFRKCGALHADTLLVLIDAESGRMRFANNVDGAVRSGLRLRSRLPGFARITRDRNVP